MFTMRSPHSKNQAILNPSEMPSQSVKLLHLPVKIHHWKDKSTLNIAFIGKALPIAAFPVVLYYTIRLHCIQIGFIILTSLYYTFSGLIHFDMRAIIYRIIHLICINLVREYYMFCTVAMLAIHDSTSTRGGLLFILSNT